MADFKIRRIDAQVVQNADYIHNQESITRLQVTPGTRAQLENILADITALTQAGAVSDEVVHELRNSVLAAADEADTPEPRWHRLTAALSHAKEIAAGLTATAGIAESIDGVIKVLGGGA